MRAPLAPLGPKLGQLGPLRRRQELQGVEPELDPLHPHRLLELVQLSAEGDDGVGVGLLGGPLGPQLLPERAQLVPSRLVLLAQLVAEGSDLLLLIRIEAELLGHSSPTPALAHPEFAGAATPAAPHARLATSTPSATAHLSITPPGVALGELCALLRREELEQGQTELHPSLLHHLVQRAQLLFQGEDGLLIGRLGAPELVQLRSELL